MYKTINLISLIGVCIILICTPVKAEITPQLLQEWGRQPSNVQWNVFYQNTAINVVDDLGWQSPNLYDTYAYTTLNVNNGKVGKKRYCLGAYKTLEEAADARKKAEEKYRKPFLEKETLS